MKRNLMLEGTGKKFNNGPTFKRIWKDNELNKECTGTGLSMSHCLMIKACVADIVDDLKFEDIKGAVKKAEDNESNYDTESVHFFNKTYRQLVLEADNANDNQKDSGTDAAGDVYYLTIHNNGACTLLNKDGLFNSELNDDTLTQLTNMISKTPEKFIKGKSIYVKSAAAAAEDDKDAEETMGKAKSLFAAENITGEAPEFEDDTKSGFAVDTENIVSIAQNQVDSFSKVLLKSKNLAKTVDMSKIEDPKSVGNFLFKALCAGIYAKAIIATKKSAGDAANKEKANKEALEKANAEIKKRVEDWKQACIAFQKALPALEIAKACDLPGGITIQSGGDVKFPDDTEQWDYQGKSLGKFALAGNEIDSDSEIQELRNFLNLDYKNDRPAHPESIKKIISVIHARISTFMEAINYVIKYKGKEHLLYERVMTKRIKNKLLLEHARKYKSIRPDIILEFDFNPLNHIKNAAAWVGDKVSSAAQTVSKAWNNITTSDASKAEVTNNTNLCKDWMNKADEVMKNFPEFALDAVKGGQTLVALAEAAKNKDAKK